MGLDLGKLKSSVISKVRRLTGEMFLSPQQKQMLRDLFCMDENKQMAAASEIGKSGDIQLLCIMQFYVQDDFLDELLTFARGRELHYQLAQKRMIKFYALVASSNMLSNQPFYEGVVGTIKSPHEPVQERCDLIYMLGSVFESFGQEIHSREAAFISEKIGGMFIGTLLSVLASEQENETVKVASAMALKKTIANPSISTELAPDLAGQVFGRLAEYKEVLQ